MKHLMMKPERKHAVDLTFHCPIGKFEKECVTCQFSDDTGCAWLKAINYATHRISKTGSSDGVSGLRAQLTVYDDTWENRSKLEGQSKPDALKPFSISAGDRSFIFTIIY